MKKTDIAMIVLVASMSVLVSYFVVSALPFFKDVNKPVVVQVADPIVVDEDSKLLPDPTVFNKQAINPTVEVYIGGDQPADTLPLSSSRE